MSSAERTEKPTPKRREEARKKGQVARSQEVSSLFVLIAGFGVLATGGAAMLARFEDTMRVSLTAAALPDLDEGGFGRVATAMLAALIVLTLPILIATAVAALVSSVIQVRPRITFEALKPDFKRMNPITGAKRFFSPNTFVEAFKGCFKLAVVGAVLILTLWPERDTLIATATVDPRVTLGTVADLAMSLTWRVLGTLVVLAGFDVVWTRYQHEKQLKMSKEEVKQEGRQQDIAPEIRGRIRSKQRELSRSRMLRDVEHADVVLTNPTHYAIALQYRKGMRAPRVLAKGADLLAKRIRDLADEHGIPLVEDPPLARQLYAGCEVGHDVPHDMFAAVAEVLAFVWRTSRKHRELGWV